MDSKRKWKVWAVILMVIWAGLYFLPSMVNDGVLPGWFTNVFSKKLNYGLDLKGGLELKYTVDYKKAIGDNALKLRESLSDRLIGEYAKKEAKDPQTLTDEERKGFEGKYKIERPEYNVLKVTFVEASDIALLTQDVVDTLDRRFVLRQLDATSAQLLLPEKAIGEIKNEVVAQTLDTIRKRVEGFGLVEPDVRRSGESDIDVQLPGLSKRQMKLVRERIGQTAQLTFRIVDRNPFFGDKKPLVDEFKKDFAEKAKTLEWVAGSGDAYIKSEKKSELLSFFKYMKTKTGLPKDENQIGFQVIEDKDPVSGQLRSKYWRTLYLFSRVELAGDHLTRAVVGYDQKNQPVVNLEFDSQGARMFAAVTEKHTKELMAIMLDDDVNSAPQIREKISGGRAQITLGGERSPREMLEEAKSLVTVLNNGAYKAPVLRVHDLEVGPSLGRDAIRSGVLSMFVGSLLVIFFMLIYYKFSGMVANIALLANVLFIFALLVSFNAALTLPGMAGIVLTVGMAVDANVLIFERVREELRAGRTHRSAIDIGYAKAFWTIFDAHITTALSGVVLLFYTTGPIYGFAVTLLIGITCSLFTAIVITRMIYDYLFDVKKVESVSI